MDRAIVKIGNKEFAVGHWYTGPDKTGVKVKIITPAKLALKMVEALKSEIKNCGSVHFNDGEGFYLAAKDKKCELYRNAKTRKWSFSYLGTFQNSDFSSSDDLIIQL